MKLKERLMILKEMVMKLAEKLMKLEERLMRITLMLMRLEDMPTKLTKRLTRLEALACSSLKLWMIPTLKPRTGHALENAMKGPLNAHAIQTLG